MKRLLIVLSILASAPAAMACPPDVVPDDGGGGSFSFGGYGAGAGACEAPMIAGNFGVGAGYGYGGMPVASFGSATYGVPIVQGRAYIPSTVGFGRSRFHAGFGAGYGGGGGFAVARPRFRGGFGVGAYGGFAAPVRVRSFGASVYAAPVVAAPVYAAPVVAVPVRAPGPIRGAIGGFFGGLRNRLNGF